MADTTAPSLSRSVALDGVYYEYADCSRVFPSQLRYSSAAVHVKMTHMQVSGAAQWDEHIQSWILKYDDGNSALHLDEAVPAVKSADGYVLCDGHHQMLALLSLGAKTIPVKIIADLSTLNEQDFWQEMELRGWAYPYTLLGDRAIPPKDFHLLQDDPNRYFAALIARKYAPNGDLNTSRGAEYPVWIKVGQDAPFIEFKIADALWKEGLRYDYSMGLHPTPEFVEEARFILKKAQIPGLKLVSERTHYSELQPPLKYTENDSKLGIWQGGCANFWSGASDHCASTRRD